ncbi:hypothetical protein E8E14_005441 [Neopestalotiopsis sp. 37M]|nr:hypothetical protein E8E14_005441 [Neopestalotiopsis sp. 37M]
MSSETAGHSTGPPDVTATGSEVSTIHGKTEADVEASDKSEGIASSQTKVQHPRDSISERRWKIILCTNLLLSVIGGYDTSNVANVQVSVYRAFGHIELLPWLSLSYSLIGVAVIPLVRKLTLFCDLKWMGLLSCLLTCAASALAGAAPNIESVIVGRVLMAIGSATLYQVMLCYNVIFARPSELALVQALVAVAFAIGLIAGPIIGGAFAENAHATWRWAFYIIVPVVAAASSLVLLYPSYRLPTNKPALRHLRDIDWVGCILWMGIFVMYGFAAVFSGSVWDWSSGSAIAIWAVLGLTICAFAIQQYLNLFTTHEHRAIPWKLFSNRSVALPMLCVWMAGVVYGATLYYTPIYFAFTHGHGALAAAVRLLPFIGVFIFMIFLAGTLLPVVGYYKVFFLIGAALMLIGGGLQQTITPQSSEGRVMGYEAIVAAGAGLVWPISLPIASTVLPPQDRMDAAALFNMGQMGGISLSLAMSGAIYENLGSQLVGEVVAGLNLSHHDIRELLSGADSSATTLLSPDLLTRVVDAVTQALVSCFYMTLAGSAVAFIAACCMKFEALNLRGMAAQKHAATASSEQGGKTETAA